MITSAYRDNCYEFRGLSTDIKPLEEKVSNGSVFFEIDTGKVFMLERASDTWVELDAGSSGGGGDFDPSKYYTIQDIDGLLTNIDQEKVDLATYATGAAGLEQADARLIIENPELYEGKIIQFYSNTEDPHHLISYGFLLTSLDPTHDKYLIEIDREGHTIKWTKETNYNANEGIMYREI